MGQRLFGGAPPNYSLRTNLKPAFVISLKRLKHPAFFVKKFYYAFIVPHKLTKPSSTFVSTQLWKLGIKVWA
ncbi:MAG: hypothetical protein CW716_06800 [Candidatus Bathyarchaeum sp.]|nr:MAG: hypothetical protein CW716_06800 [Candidatus Bathyarchaeum sp.]